MRATSLIAGLCALTTTLAASLTITIPPSPPLLPNPHSLPPSTQAQLLGPRGELLTARLSRQNTLSFPSLADGSYLLTLHSQALVFAPLRVDVGPAGVSAAQTFRGNEWGHKGPALGAATDEGHLAVDVRPVARRDFYAARPGFSVLSLFKNPMILMALVSAGLVFGMPYLIDNMDDETKAAWEEEQKKSPLAGAMGGDPAAALGNFDFAGWMAGSGRGPAVETAKASEGTKSLR